MSRTFFCQNWENASSAEKKQKIKDELFGTTPVIVYVDDDEGALEIFEHHLQQLGFETYATENVVSAIDYIKKNKSRVLMIISDYNMNPVNGFDFRDQVLEFASELPFAILSGFVDRELALKGVEHKITAFIEKPLQPSDLLSFIKKEGETRLEVMREELEMLKGFTDDASNLVENIEELCLELESNPHKPEVIARIFGMVHTIKGSSGFFEPRDLHNFSHKFEDLLKDVQNGSMVISQQMISVFLKANDILKAMVEEFKTGVHKNYNLPEMVKMFQLSSSAEQGSSKPSGAEHATEAQATTSERSKVTEIKVSMSLLNEFMQTSGEMTVIRNMINKTVRNLEKQYQGDKEIALLGELLEEMHKINSDVQNKITDIRRVPVSTLVKPLSRAVRDTARALSKEVDFIVEGEELRLDNSIAEVLSKSLIHMMRNSIDHGIEHPERRVQAGKKNKGVLCLKFGAQGENIIIDILDDGAGINIEKIREKVVEKGIKTQIEAQKMSEQELQYMIFDSGFSTAQQVTDFSGRGVGMSMVKDSVESLKGKIHIESHLGKGTHFKLEIPIPKSVMITNCVFVSVGGKSFGIPQDHVLKVIDKTKLSKAEITELQGAEVIRYDDHLIPISSISKLMGMSGRQSYENLIVVIKAEKTTFALNVESVLDIEDAVIKPLTLMSLKNLGLYLGGTFLGDGTIGLVFNVEGVAQKLNISQHQAKAQARQENEHQESQVTKNFIVFDLQKPGHFCLEEKDIQRIEMIDPQLIQRSGGQYVVPYRGTSMNLVDLDQLIEPKLYPSLLSAGKSNSIATIIIQNHNHYVGLVVKQIIDLKAVSGDLQSTMMKQFGIGGCYIIDGQVTSVINLAQILDHQSESETTREDRDKMPKAAFAA